MRRKWSAVRNSAVLAVLIGGAALLMVSTPLTSSGVAASEGVGHPLGIPLGPVGIHRELAVSEFSVSQRTNSSFDLSWNQPASVTNDTLWIRAQACPALFGSGGISTDGPVSSYQFAGLGPPGQTFCLGVRPWSGPLKGSMAEMNVTLAPGDIAGTVRADVDGYGPSPTMVGANVTVYSETCAGKVPTVSGCPVVANTSTGSGGAFSLEVPSGSYYVAVAPDPEIADPSYLYGFGGAAANVTTPNQSINLTVYPFVPYGNSTLVLPGYACLRPYLDDYDGQGPGCQNPVLSWTQDGAYYVNATDELVFYSFVNRTVYAIAPWTPLFQSFPSYAMIPNLLEITQDGTFIYSWGTLTSKSTVVTAEAVNVTTHQVFLYDFTSFGTSAVQANGQVQMTGWDGNDSQFTVILSSGAVVDHDIWSSGESPVATMDFFEANNVYWEPYLNGYIDVEADGSSSDYVEEWQLTGPTSTTLEKTYDQQWKSGGGIIVNGVNGVSFNASSRELSVQAEYSGLVYQVSGSGTLTTLLVVTNLYHPGKPPAEPLGNAAASDRATITTEGPFYGGNYQGFGNDSWLVNLDPGHLGYESTNVSPYVYNGVLPFSYAWIQWFQEGMFYNTSYLIAPVSYACAPGGSFCPINGTGDYVPGTIWWMWRLGLPEFPNPRSAPMADVLPPPPTDVTAARATNSSIALQWTPPVAFGLINYTVSWGTSAGPAGSASVPPTQDHYTIEGLDQGTAYDLQVEAWNLHFHGGSEGISLRYTEAAATNLSLTSVTASSVSLSWTNPTEPFTSVELDYGVSPSGPTTNLSVGTDSEHNVSGLSSDLTYYFEVVAWNGSVAETPSNQVEAETLNQTAVTNLRVVSTSSSWITLKWSNPSGEFTNLTLDYGTSPSALSVQLSIGTPSEYTLEGLPSGTTYWFEIVAWNGTTAALPSNEVEASTFVLPKVTALSISLELPESVSLSWTNPVTEFTNLSIELGSSPSTLGNAISVGVPSQYTVTGLDPGTNYWFEVVPWNGTTQGIGSGVVEGSTPELPVVTSFTILSTNLTSVSSSWTNPSEPYTNLTFEYGTSPSVPQYQLSLGIAPSSYVVSDLSPGTAYWFVVVPWNEGVRGTPSQEIQDTTPTFPGASALQVTSSGPNSISLAWTIAPAPLTNETLECGTNPSNLSDQVELGPVSNETVTGLSPETRYWFEVVPWNGAYPGTPSNLVEGTTAAAAPILLYITSVGARSVSLAWKGAPNATSSLEILMGTHSTGLNGKSWVPGGTASYVLENLSRGATYWFEVVAFVNSTGSGPGAHLMSPYSVPSEELSVRTLGSGGSESAFETLIVTPWTWPVLAVVLGAVAFITARWKSGSVQGR